MLPASNTITPFNTLRFQSGRTQNPLQYIIHIMDTQHIIMHHTHHTTSHHNTTHPLPTLSKNTVYNNSILSYPILPSFFLSLPLLSSFPLPQPHPSRKIDQNHYATLTDSERMRHGWTPGLENGDGLRDSMDSEMGMGWVVWSSLVLICHGMAWRGYGWHAVDLMNTHLS